MNGKTALQRTLDRVGPSRASDMSTVEASSGRVELWWVRGKLIGYRLCYMASSLPDAPPPSHHENIQKPEYEWKVAAALDWYTARQLIGGDPQLTKVYRKARNAKTL